jgi:hypothetical protein
MKVRQKAEGIKQMEPGFLSFVDSKVYDVSSLRMGISVFSATFYPIISKCFDNFFDAKS